MRQSEERQQRCVNVRQGVKLYVANFPFIRIVLKCLHISSEHVSQSWFIETEKKGKKK